MEDAHTAIPSYKDTGTSYFGVFDGHGGKLDDIQEDSKSLNSLYYPR